MLMHTREGTTIVTQPEFPTITSSHFYSLSNDVAERRKRLKLIVWNAGYNLIKLIKSHFQIALSFKSFIQFLPVFQFTLSTNWENNLFHATFVFVVFYLITYKELHKLIFSTTQ